MKEHSARSHVFNFGRWVMDDKTLIHRPENLTDNFSVIPNAIINDRRLSYKSRGILLYLLSKPKDWKCMIRNLISDLDGRTSVLSGLRELRSVGYMSYVITRDTRTKRVISAAYYVYPSPERNPRRETSHPLGVADETNRKPLPDKDGDPKSGFLFSDDPKSGFPLSENLKSEKRALLSIDLTNHGDEKTTTHPEQAATPPTPAANPDVVVFLASRGVKGKAANDLAATYSRKRIEEAVGHLDVELMKTEIANPAGWLVQCLRGDWSPPPPSAAGSKAKVRDTERIDRLKLSQQGRHFIASVQGCMNTISDDDFRKFATLIVRDAEPELKAHFLANPTKTNWLLAEKVYARVVRAGG